MTLWTVARQAPLSIGFSRQEYWTRLPFPSPGDLPNRGIEPGSPRLQADSLPSEPPGCPVIITTTFCNGCFLLFLFPKRPIARPLALSCIHSTLAEHTLWTHHHTHSPSTWHSAWGTSGRHVEGALNHTGRETAHTRAGQRVGTCSVSRCQYWSQAVKL